MRYGDGRYAACDEHAAEGLRSLDGAQAVESRRVTGVDGYTCHCGKPADWYLMEVVVTDESGQPGRT
jgi:hypothetical protein